MTPAAGQTLTTVSGLATFFHEAGDGPPVVLLHGSGAGVSAWANWGRVIAPLAERFRVLAPDMAGFGDSPWPEGGVDIKVWVRQLIEFLDARGVDKVSAVGNSFGGGLALAAALRHPDRFDRLVLMGTPAGSFPQTEGLRAGLEFEPTLEFMERTLRRLAYDPAIVTPEMVRSRHEAALRQGGMEAFRRLMPPPAPAGDTPIVRGVSEEALRTLPHHALVLHGREDAVVPLDCALRLGRCLENAQLHVFPKCGHWVQLEQEARFLQLVSSFLSERGG